MVPHERDQPFFRQAPRSIGGDIDCYGLGHSEEVVARALDALRKSAAGVGNTMTPLLECVRAYATLGEICDTLREVFGEHTESAVL